MIIERSDPDLPSPTAARVRIMLNPVRSPALIAKRAARSIYLWGRRRDARRRLRREGQTYAQQGLAVTNTIASGFNRKLAELARRASPIKLQSKIARAGRRVRRGVSLLCALVRSGDQMVGDSLRRCPHHERHGARGHAPRKVLSDH